MTEQENTSIEPYIREIKDWARTIQEDYEYLVGLLERLSEETEKSEDTEKSSEAEFNALTGKTSCSS